MFKLSLLISFAVTTLTRRQIYLMREIATLCQSRERLCRSIDLRGNLLRYELLHRECDSFIFLFLFMFCIDCFYSINTSVVNTRIEVRYEFIMKKIRFDQFVFPRILYVLKALFCDCQCFNLLLFIDRLIIKTLGKLKLIERQYKSHSWI